MCNRGYAKTEMPNLGHTVSKNVIKVDLTKIEAVLAGLSLLISMKATIAWPHQVLLQVHTGLRQLDYATDCGAEEEHPF